MPSYSNSVNTEAISLAQWLELVRKAKAEGREPPPKPDNLKKAEEAAKALKEAKKKKVKKKEKKHKGTFKIQQ